MDQSNNDQFVVSGPFEVTGPFDLSASDLELGQPQYRFPGMWKSRFLNWKVAGAILAISVLLGWICLIGLMILKEKWQLVLVAWLLLYAAFHFTYWYCKRNSIFSLHRTVRLRIIGEIQGTATEKADKPPSYDEVANTEEPPPSYYMAVTENRSDSQIAEVHHCHPSKVAEATASSSNEQPDILPSYSVAMSTSAPYSGAMSTSTPVCQSPIHPSLSNFNNHNSTPSLNGEEPEPSTSLGVPQRQVKKLSTFSSIVNAVEALKSLGHDRDETRHTGPEPSTYM